MVTIPGAQAMTTLTFGLAFLLATDPPPTTADFERDTGLSVTDVHDLRSRSGGPHYPMRSYSFSVPDTSLDRLQIKLRPFDAEDGFHRAARELLDVHAPDSGITADLAPAELARSFLRSLRNRTLVACYPQDTGFGFRVAVIEPADVATGLQHVQFAAAGDLSGDPAEGCRGTRSTFSWLMTEIITGSTHLRPYPFAEQLFDQLISPSLPSMQLHAHADIFMDSEYYLKFQASRETFIMLTKEKSMMRAFDPEDTAVSQPIHAPWWSPASESPWFQSALDRDGRSAVARAQWHDGWVYWHSKGR
jgi:hypothetical protein